LRDQLAVTEPEFWSCVEDGIKPNRGEPEIPLEALPADVVYLLITRVGLDETTVSGCPRARR
jgi:hypothetical protein